MRFQGRIDKVLDKMSSKDINERRRGDLDKFLTTTNTKAAVFRDIIIESGEETDQKVMLLLANIPFSLAYIYRHADVNSFSPSSTRKHAYWLPT